MLSRDNHEIVETGVLGDKRSLTGTTAPLTKRQRSEKSTPNVDKIYTVGRWVQRVVLRPQQVKTGSDEELRRLLLARLVEDNEGQCVERGFVRPGSTRVVEYSGARIQNNVLLFDVLLECSICLPVVHEVVWATVHKVTKAGVHAHVVDGRNVPVVVFLVREFHQDVDAYQYLQEGAQVEFEVTAVRYELTDPQVTVLGNFVSAKNLSAHSWQDREASSDSDLDPNPADLMQDES